MASGSLLRKGGCYGVSVCDNISNKYSTVYDNLYFLDEFKLRLKKICLCSDILYI